MPPEPPGQPGSATSAPAASGEFGSAYAAGLLNEFFEVAPGALSDALAVERAVNRTALARALERYAKRLGSSEATLKNIKRLMHPNARAVVAGQQVGLLLGPTFTLSKAITAVNLAQQLDSPDRPVVPVFWLATQDHDVAEVDHTYLLDGNEALHRLSVQLPPGQPTGRAPVTKAMLDQVLAGLTQLQPQPRFLAEVTSLVTDSAALGGYGDWFASMLTRLLGSTGLVLVDPLQPDFAALTLDVLKAEIREPARSSEAVNGAAVRLKALGFEPQLGRGANATNLFIELDTDTPHRQRTLLRHQGRSFYADGQKFSAADLLTLLEQDPTVITPAAGLRPVTQDAALPTAALVLGPGELRYVAQLRGVYEAHGVPMPLAWPRASASVLEPAAKRMLGSLGLSAAQFRRNHQAELERFVLSRSGQLGRFQQAAAVVETTFDELFEEAGSLDPTLRGTVERGRRHMQMTLERLRTKSARAALQRDETASRQFQRLLAHLLPLGQPAERVLSPFSHAVKFGVQPLLDRFLKLEPSGDQELEL